MKIRPALRARAASTQATLSGLSAPALNSHTSLEARSRLPSTNSAAVTTSVGPPNSVSRHRAKYWAVIADPPDPIAIVGRPSPVRMAAAMSVKSAPKTRSTV
ncbi:MAG: hypothetical protein JNN10_07010 [Sphingopyxis sp.]|uniref:hypothetical protein n=1 Tax=Sphingopyxis sp. TaxID=1908224 RepID=UPI001A5C2D1E|nr:hypothetical protein [Sphingopyxis sp.]MBL9066025.1 hypothetical protein [Sphingopyxis sp.]